MGQRQKSTSLEVMSSPGLGSWLRSQGISLAFTTYQTNRLVLVGTHPQGQLALQERLFDKPMGLYAERDHIYMSTRYQIWRLENVLRSGETYQGSDRLYVPTQSYTTGDLNVHDVALDANQNLIFINTDFSCLATLRSGYSFAPVWKPAFISKLAPEDRCHLNGLALVEGQPTYVTACSATDAPAGWRDQRQQGGVVLHIPSNEILATGLSMPHSPRWYRDRLWLLNAGTGELGYLAGSEFVPITFCPGFVRGLAFWGDFAFVGMSKLRARAFSGLTLETRLAAAGKPSQCGLLVIDLTQGRILHWLSFEGVIEELFDIVVLPGALSPRALGFQGEEIERLITFPGSKGLIASKPTVKRPSLDPITPIAGLPRQVWEGQTPDAAEFDLVNPKVDLAVESLPAPAAPPKFQRVYHLNPESLLPYEALTYPSLQKRWQTQPQQGELVGISAAIHGELVGFAIAELLPNLHAELISCFVEPLHRQQGIGTRLLTLLEQALRKENCVHLTLVYAPTAWTERALEPMLQKLGWQSPTTVDPQLRRSHKSFVSHPIPPTSAAATISPLSSAARLQVEQGKQRAKQGDLAGAVQCFSDAVRLQPDYLAAYNRLGNALQTLGRFEEAVAAYQSLIQLNPQLAAAHCNLASLWQLQGKTAEAIATYRHALQLQPDFVMAHRNLGNLLANQKRLLEAEACLREALRLQPESADLHQDLGNVLRQVGNLEGAIACYRQALRLKPDFSEAIQNLGCLFMLVGNMELAQSCFQRVLKLDPNAAGAYTNLANTLEAQGHLIPALAAYNRALELNPAATDVLYQQEHLRLTLCDWENFDARMQMLQGRIEAHIRQDCSPKLSPFFINNFPVPIELHTAVARCWSDSISQAIADLKAQCAFTPPPAPAPHLRLGYLSADFRCHAMGSLICDLFQHHDRSAFEIYAYSLTDTQDEITAIIQAGCDVFSNIASLSAEAAARQIHQDGIHILIDLAGYTAQCRPEIVALQPAPLQVQYLGYPDTMGAEFMPYILADRQLIPPELAIHYTEQVVEIPHTFVASSLPTAANSPFTRESLGLPAQGMVYCCFNRTDKFDPHQFALWMRILQQVPESVLWMTEPIPEVSQTLRRIAQQQGVQPERLIFSPKLPLAEFIAACQLADLFLDTFTYNAGATAICSLSVGVPMLTHPGKTFVSRMGASICAAAGLETLICATPAEYEQKAVYLGHHPEALAAIRQTLLSQKSDLALFDTAQFVRELELALSRLWQALSHS